MIINYYNSYDDYKKAYERFFKVARNMKCISIALVSFAMYLFYSLYLDEMSEFYIIDTTDHLKAILIMIIVDIICFFIINSSLKSKVNREINALLTLRPTLIGERTLEINDEYIVTTNNKERTEQRVKGIDNIKEVDGRIILYIQKLSPIHIIPCNAFANNEDKDKFLSYFKHIKR